MTVFPTVILLQARINSTRLPEKLFALLAGESVIRHCIMRLSLVDLPLFLAVPETDTEIIAGHIKNSTAIIGGAEHNVLARFLQAAQRVGAETIIRATADNPLIAYELIMPLYEKHIALHSDYTHYTGLPLGCGVEIINVAALLDLHKTDLTAAEREHVCPGLYNRSDRYIINHLPVPPEYSSFVSLRVTLDEKNDLTVLQSVYDALYHDKPIPTRTALTWLIAHPNVSSLNSTVRQKSPMESEQE